MPSSTRFKRRLRVLAGIGALALACGALAAGSGHDQAAHGGGDHSDMAQMAQEVQLPDTDFVVPEPGSYTLYRIMDAPDGSVLDVNSQEQPLSRFTRGKITLLSFIYTHCDDINGCPLAYVVNQQIKGAIEHRPELQALRGKVRIVSLSFDPRNDTPEVMRQYGGGAGTPTTDAAVEWDFLTTSGPEALVPLLNGFGQDVSVAANAPDHEDDFSHVLKVFLLDPGGSVREIYSNAYLHPRMVLTDMQTLVLEQGDKSG